MKSSSGKIRRSSFYLISITAVLIILSLVTITQTLKTYKDTGYIDFLALTLSASAIAFSVYMVLQMRESPLKLGFEQPKVSTVIRCSKCGFETTREFKEGDYILKESEPCPQCKGPTFIYIIFRETEEKRKKKKESSSPI